MVVRRIKMWKRRDFLIALRAVVMKAEAGDLYCTTVISTYAQRKDDAHCLTCGNGHSAIEISRQRFQ